MKLIISGVTFSAAQARSPSFSRSSSSTMMTSRPARKSSMACSMVAKGMFAPALQSLHLFFLFLCGTSRTRYAQSISIPAQLDTRSSIYSHRHVHLLYEALCVRRILRAHPLQGLRDRHL